MSLRTFTVFQDAPSGDEPQAKVSRPESFGAVDLSSPVFTDYRVPVEIEGVEDEDVQSLQPRMDEEILHFSSDDEIQSLPQNEDPLFR